MKIWVKERHNPINHMQDPLPEWMIVFLNSRKIHNSLLTMRALEKLSLAVVSCVASLNNDWFNSNKLNSRNHGNFFFFFSLSFLHVREHFHCRCCLFLCGVVTFVDVWMLFTRVAALFKFKMKLWILVQCWGRLFCLQHDVC